MCFWLNGRPLVLSLQLNASHSFLLHDKAVFISSFKSDGQNICFCPRINFAIFHWMISKANDFANVAKDVPGILDLIRHSRTQQCKMVNFQSSAPQQMEWLEQFGQAAAIMRKVMALIRFATFLLCQLYSKFFILREQKVEKLNCIVKFWKCRRNFQRKDWGGWGRGWKIFSSEHKGCCWSDVSLAAVQLCCKMLLKCKTALDCSGLHLTALYSCFKTTGHWPLGAGRGGKDSSKTLEPGLSWNPQEFPWIG